jgi:predicted mannosyl-3-phosphoglycerate phosphatase (HAD superfamily)
MSAINRPIQIEEFTVAVREVPDAELYTLKEQLTKSIAKLEKTNNKLEKLIKGQTPDSDDEDDDDEFDDIGQEDRDLFQEIITENTVVASNQQQRIDRVNDELQYRGLSKETQVQVQIPADAVSEKITPIDTDNNVVDANAPNCVFL